MNFVGDGGKSAGEGAAVLPELRTDRLVLGALSPHYVHGIFALFREPEVCRFAGGARDLADRDIPMPLRSPADARRILDFLLDLQSRGQGCRWVMRLAQDEAFVGLVGFNALGRCAEIAFHQLPEYWGQGLMGEACAAVMTWAREEAGARQFDAYVDPANDRSQRLLERMGFQPTGFTRDGARRLLLDDRASSDG